MSVPPRGFKSIEDLEAALVDLDGVVTRTAQVHARAWKELFDDYLERRRSRAETPFRPFDIDTDYAEYVDGKPRHDGVRSFLRSRGVELPDGEPGGRPGRETIHGLGKAKDESFLRLIRRDGVEVWEDAVRQLRRWRERGWKTAVVSSSRNCAEVLDAAGISDLFHVRVDGVSSEELRLEGKPAPDIFLEAARRLGVEPAAAMVVEDAAAGVRAGRRGGFGLVVGVDRKGRPRLLRSEGADVIVRTLDELAAGPSDPSRLPSALEGLDRLADSLRGRRPAVFADYDGTLTPIVLRPDLATLSDETRDVLRRLASRHFVAIVSGRDRADVERLVGLDGIVYAGSHGFDISGPDGLRLEHDGARACLGDLDEAEAALEDRLRDVAGALVERKRFAIAVHYRQVSDADVPVVERVVDRVLAERTSLDKRGGKKVFELRPRIDWDKGKAVLWLLGEMELDSEDVVPLYLGDDDTDEDAFRALVGRGPGILVDVPSRPTFAEYVLRDPAEVERFLAKLIEVPSRENR